LRPRKLAIAVGDSPEIKHSDLCARQASSTPRFSQNRIRNMQQQKAFRSLLIRPRAKCDLACAVAGARSFRAIFAARRDAEVDPLHVERFVTTALGNLVDHPWTLFGVLFGLLVVFVELGHQVRSATGVANHEDLRESLVSTRDSISLLLSLLLGFTLAMALPRFDDRKKLLVDEANSIGTAALRTRMLPEPARSKILQILSEYVDARLDFSVAQLNGEELQRSLVRTKQLQDQMWREIVVVAQQNPTPITSILVQALNESIDLTEKRRATLENRVPNAVWLLLVLVSCLSCLAIGISERRRFWFVMVVSPLTIAIVMALIADLDAPRSGLIQTGQQSLRRLQQDLKSGGREPQRENPLRVSP
jgi:hypothetical protein